MPTNFLFLLNSLTLAIHVLIKMEKNSGTRVSELFGSLGSLLRRCMFRILSIGPIPNHFAFIMDGNRRYAKKQQLEEGAGHRAGFSVLMSMLKYCYELGVTYVTIYAFSIENFKRRPDEVQNLMDLILEKIEGLLNEESIVNEYGIRVYFIGNLKLLSEPVWVAAEKVMKATANNTKCMLLICIAYTSCDEIVHAIHESCKNKWEEIQPCNSHKVCNGGIEVVDGKKIDDGVLQSVQELCRVETNELQATRASTARSGVAEGVERTGKINGVAGHAVHGSCDKWDEVQSLEASRSGNGVISNEESKKLLVDPSILKVVDIERHMYMSVAPDPDVVIRSSGETRLSNFLLWQTSNCLLYSPNALWPDMRLWHLVWAVLDFQRSHSYFEKKKKQL
ncbi:unnamed protein product [Dovyalis caffra]|uniref:Alkyl transferase n=1 Tax=Dovyalis caffra TaxID=77055 RepID=A0AAV1SNF7_9ROSI|nr:unnamed protein product [Dovyalis caffra]